MTEHQIQAAFVSWCQWNERNFPALRAAFAVPNGGQRNIVTAKKLKAEGVRPGVPDWMCPVAVHPFIGLCVEFKAKGGRLSPSQRDYREILLAAGWCYQVAWSPEEGMAAVTTYFAHSPSEASH